MRISDWSSDVCSSDLLLRRRGAVAGVVSARFLALERKCPVRCRERRHGGAGRPQPHQPLLQPFGPGQDGAGPRAARRRRPRARGGGRTRLSFLTHIALGLRNQKEERWKCSTTRAWSAPAPVGGWGGEWHGR